MHVEEQSDVVGFEAADQPPIIARISAESAGAHAGGIAQDLVELFAFWSRIWLRADHRDRLRRLHDRRVGLGAGRLRLAT